MMKKVDERISVIVENSIAQILSNLKTNDSATVASSGAVSVDSIIFEIENAARYLINNDKLPEYDSVNESEKLACVFVELLRWTAIRITQNAFSEHVSNSEEAKQIMDALQQQIDEILPLLSNNYRSANGNLASIYRRLIAMT